MSALRIGQRIKKVRGAGIGTTGTVLGFDFDTGDSCTLKWAADSDVVSTNNQRHVPAGRPIWSPPEMFEPLLPEGWQTVEWSECLWQPEGIAA